MHRTHPPSALRWAGAAALVAALALAGCMTVVVRPRVVTDAYRAAPVAPGDVAVVRRLPLDSVPPACERVAVLQGSGQQDFSEAGELVAALRKEAGKVGANLVAILSWEEAGRGERVANVLLRTGVDRDAVALALRCPGEAVPELERRWR